MPIDNSMYSNMRGLDLGAARQEGMKMSDMIKQRRDQEAQREAYKAGAVVGPDGKTTFDPSLTASALAKGGFGKEANELTRQADADKRSKLDDQFKQAGMIAQLTADVKDQPSWESALGQAKTMGLDVSQVPMQYDPGLVNSLRGRALTIQDRMSQQNKERELKIREMEAMRKGAGDPFADEMKYQRLADHRRKQEEAAFKKTPEGRLQGLGAEGKQRFDNAKLGLKTVQGMADALLRNDQNTFSVIGDNDFTQQRALFEESLGRMQSGGAISKPEEERFKAMAPTWRDSPAIQKKKLEYLQSEMRSRLGTLGFNPQEVGVADVDISKMKKGDDSAYGIDRANAAPAPKVFKTNEIDWAE
ncbi:MAG: hypothetical protein IPJ84_19140 [Bdellovibrionales bacterium]|nr:hypothetical protein [Bdellovibrionales bacterium]MBK7892886.1 hypothetical protein [Bdellovibrionales bacterium]